MAHYDWDDDLEEVKKDAEKLIQRYEDEIKDIIDFKSKCLQHIPNFLVYIIDREVMSRELSVKKEKEILNRVSSRLERGERYVNCRSW